MFRWWSISYEQLTTAITGRQEKTMSSENATNAAPVDGIVLLRIA
jgi:hypothetical protein